MYDKDLSKLQDKKEPTQDEDMRNCYLQRFGRDVIQPRGTKGRGVRMIRKDSTETRIVIIIKRKNGDTSKMACV